MSTVDIFNQVSLAEAAYADLEDVITQIQLENALIAVENGRLIPVEIKSHRQVEDSDRLELAFYWRLLEPIQKDRRKFRKGYVWLNTGKVEEVPLDKFLFERLDNLIIRVRETKVEGAQPQKVPECDYCVFKEEHLKIIRGSEDLSLIYDIGLPRRERLHELGVINISGLAALDLTDLHQEWRKIDRYAPSIGQLQKMQAHANAWLEDVFQIVGNEPIPDNRQAIVLDLEYETWSRRQIFVVGALIVEEGKETTLYQEFAENIDDERRILSAFAELLSRLEGYKVVTWNGTAADLIEIESAWQRLGLPQNALDKFREKHVDLLYVTRSNFRFPTTSFGLKEIAAYFRYIRTHPELGSFEIPWKYSQYLSNRDVTLKQEILEHNADDLRALLLVWNQLRELSTNQQ